MANALFVNIVQKFGSLNAVERRPQAQAMQDITSRSWLVSPESAKDVRYLFGVVKGVVKSAYTVTQPAEEWPIEQGTEKRRIVPVSDRIDPKLFRGLLGPKSRNPCSFRNVSIDESTGTFRLDD
jgi:hypothetical protein